MDRFDSPTRASPCVSQACVSQDGGGRTAQAVDTSPPPTSLTSLPDDVLTLVMGRVGPQGILALSVACKTTRRLALAHVDTRGHRDLLESALARPLTDGRIRQLEESPMARTILAQKRSLVLRGRGLDGPQSSRLIGLCPALERLDLRDNALRGVPPELGNMANLRRLDLSGNAITALEGPLFNLRGLESLRCAQNALTHVGEDISGLHDLVAFDVRDNQLPVLPESIASLPKLASLCVSQNRLTSLPSGLGACTALTNLRAERNCLTALPKNLRALQNLTNADFGDNELTEMPTELTRLPNLQRLSLRGNRIVTQTEPHIGDLRIDLAGNRAG